MTRETFNDIIHNNYRKLFFIAFRIIKNKQEAEDVVQEVFLKMWMMKEKLDNYDDCGALAVIITKNKCLDMLRKRKFIDNEKDGLEIMNRELSPSPDEQMVKSETAEILNSIIDDLPESLREVVKQREIYGLSYEEMANQNNININTLRVTLSRARHIIKEKYLKYNYERGKIKTAN